MRKLSAVISAVVLIFVISGCDSQPTKDDAQHKESATQQNNYERQVAEAPAHEFASTQTRDTINFWIDTWGHKGALSYNYVGAVDTNGVFHASLYYVLKGLPVSYCTSLTPNYKVLEYDGGTDGARAPLMVPAPAMDGVYYGPGGCDRYYGEDATTGSYVEYQVPMNMLVQTFSQPMTGEGFNNAVRVDGDK